MSKCNTLYPDLWMGVVILIMPGMGKQRRSIGCCHIVRLM